MYYRQVPQAVLSYSLAVLGSVVTVLGVLIGPKVGIDLED